MVLTGLEEGMTAVLKHKSSARTIQGSDKVGDVFFVALHWTEVFIAYAIFEVKLLGDLPRILDVGIEGVNMHPALWVADGNGGAAGKIIVAMEFVARRHISGKKVGEGTKDRVCCCTDAGRA